MKFIQDDVIRMQGFDAVFVLHQTAVGHELDVIEFHSEILQLCLIDIFTW